MIHPFSFWKTSAAAHPGQAIFNTWEAGVDAAGGTYTGSSKTIALDLADQLAVASYYSKVRYLLPLLGADLTAARMPLVDTLAVGIATNFNFVGGDFSENSGLQGNGSTKYLDLLVSPGSLNISQNGGLGYWERAATGSDSRVAMGTYGTVGGNYYMLAQWNQPGFITTSFYWGAGGGSSCYGGPIIGNNDYYGQRASATDRVQYKDGVSLNSSVVNDPATGISGNRIYLMAPNNNSNGTPSGGFWDGRCGVAYMTNGLLTSGEVAALHTLLGTYLITATGR